MRRDGDGGETREGEASSFLMSFVFRGSVLHFFGGQPDREVRACGLVGKTAKVIEREREISSIIHLNKTSSFLKREPTSPP